MRLVQTIDRDVEIIIERVSAAHDEHRRHGPEEDRGAEGHGSRSQDGRHQNGKKGDQALGNPHQPEIAVQGREHVSRSALDPGSMNGPDDGFELEEVLFDNGPRDDDIGAGLGDGRGLFGLSDAASHDQRDSDPCFDRPDEVKGNGAIRA